MAQPLLFQIAVSEGSLDIVQPRMARRPAVESVLKFEMGCHIAHQPVWKGGERSRVQHSEKGDHVESERFNFKRERRKPMRQLTFNRPISMLIITLLAISFAAVTVSLAAGPAKAIKGEVVSVDPNTGMLEVMSPEGKTIMLNAGPQIEDLKTLQKGDQVMIQYDKNKNIQSINKEG